MYILEGNIGAGKSTFLTLLAKHLPHICVTLEPMHNWQKQIYGQSLLANFYQDPKRWAYTLETLAMFCRVREHMEEQKKEDTIQITERSIYSGHYCFAQNDYESGFLDEVEWNVYNQWFNFMIPGKCKTPKGFIYLSVDPEVAYERIKKRNRASEKQITLAYLKQIHEKHEQFLVRKEGVLPELASVPLLVIDCNQEFETNEFEFVRHLEKVRDFFDRTKCYIPAGSLEHDMLA